jgi:hypothetical protein
VLFNLEFDHGECLEGYLIPDGFSDVAHIRVSDAQGVIGTFACNQSRPAVVNAGRHQTGMVGFRVDTSIVPDLANNHTLAIHDAKSGVLVYRRLATPPIARKLVRVETQILPMIKFDRHCGAHFQYELLAAERFGHETASQAFHLDSTNSIYISGRILMRNYENFLGNGFEAIAFLHDPYYEMALRIFLLKRMSTTPVSFLGDRDKMIMGPAVEYFRDANLEDSDALKALFKKAPPQVQNVLSSPVTRQLTTTSPEQRISRREIAPAIDLLSRFSVVGHSADPIAFQEAVAQLLGIPSDDLAIPPPQMLIESIADRLRNVPMAETLLEEDLIFDHYVRQAMSTAQSGVRSKNASPNAASTH